MAYEADEIAETGHNSGAPTPGWGRTRLSTFWHWFDAPPADPEGSDLPPPARTSVCEVLEAYRGPTVARIARWEIDPSVCEICRDILRARERGLPPPGQPARRAVVAIVPPGLPERIRACYRAALAAHNGEYPFLETLNAFREEGVNRQFLAGFLRYDARQAGRPWKRPLRWNEIELDAVREEEGATRVRLIRETRAGSNRPR